MIGELLAILAPFGGFLVGLFFYRVFKTPNKPYNSDRLNRLRDPYRQAEIHRRYMVAQKKMEEEKEKEKERN